MKKLRNKIFLFVALLLILPAIPLSYIISELLEKSYQIGVNEKVENALEGALDISSDFYDQQKELIREYAGKMTDSQLSFFLSSLLKRKVSISSVRKQRYKMDIKKEHGRGICKIQNCE